jgi:hypothetical protein
MKKLAIEFLKFILSSDDFLIQPLSQPIIAPISAVASVSVQVKKPNNKYLAKSQKRKS